MRSCIRTVGLSWIGFHEPNSSPTEPPILYSYINPLPPSLSHTYSSLSGQNHILLSHIFKVFPFLLILIHISVIRISFSFKIFVIDGSRKIAKLLWLFNLSAEKSSTIDMSFQLLIEIDDDKLYFLDLEGFDPTLDLVLFRNENDNFWSRGSVWSYLLTSWWCVSVLLISNFCVMIYDLF